MSTLSLTALMKYFSDEQKSVSRGENHYKSGHVINFDYSDGIISGNVQASMKAKEYRVQIELDDQLDIKQATCDCPRGRYKCSHSVALFLYALNHISRTDVPCSWRKKRHREEQVKSASELYPPTKKFDAVGRPVSESDRNWFFHELGNCGHFTGLHWLMAPEPTSPEEPSLPLVEYALNVSTNWDIFCKELAASVLKNIISCIAETTKGQTQSNAWHLVRKGRLTASNFGAVLNAKKVTSSLIERVKGDRKLGGVKAIAWGTTHERDGVAAFSSRTGLHVEETGVWLDSSGILGASPDGLVGDNAILEVKCPYTHRNDQIVECFSDKKFCLENNGEGIRLKEEHVYWHQVQGQLHLTGRQVCYFVVWTLKDIVVLGINKDPSWAPNIEILKKFYREHIFPTLVS